jgi:hypothetical protein
VYVRAFFVDNFEMFTRNATTWGVWLGGYDLSNGLVERPPIQPVSLTVGAGTAHTLPLTALRRLRVSLELANGTTPLDDGEGPGAAVVVRSAVDLENPELYGAASAPCLSLDTPETSELTGIVIGSGQFFLSAVIDDFNAGGELPPGGLLALDVNGTTYSLPDSSRFIVPPTAYTVSHSVALNFVVPLGDGGAPPPYACPVPDAGTD